MLLLTFAACGGAETCPNDLPKSCPQGAPGFQAEVSGIIASRCAICHTPGGQSEAQLLTTYAQIYARRSAVLNQLYSCRMPPLGATAPTPSERAAVLAWLVCGAPND